MTIEDILADMIRIQTVNPPGGETEVARYLKRLFDEYQIPNEIIESSPGRSSFLAYLGEGERRLLYTAHTDVVPAGEGWSFAPFSGEIKDGFVHGRGTMDCKGLVAAEAYAVIHLALNMKLGGKLIFVASADEESGGTLGWKYLVENVKDKIMADFAIGEGTGQAMRIGGKTCHFVDTGEKGVAWAKLRAKGFSSHGSLPTLGDNAIVKMAEAIRALARYQPKITLIPEVKRLIHAVAELEGFDGEVSEENVDQVIQRLGNKHLAGHMSSVTRMTVSPDVVHGGLKINTVPDTCEAEVDIRILPGQDKEYIVRELGQLIGDVDMEISNYNVASFSSSDSEHYRLISDALKEVMGDVLVLPYFCPAFTDVRYLRGVGIPSYGIGTLARNLDPTMLQSIHNFDERLDIESLRLTSDFLIKLASKYLGG